MDLNYSPKLALYHPFITVSEEELRRLGKRFKKLDIDKNGTISIEEFMSLPELQQNPLVRRVIDLFDTDRNGEIDFKGTFSYRMLSFQIIVIFGKAAKSQMFSMSITWTIISEFVQGLSQFTVKGADKESKLKCKSTNL